MIALVVTKKSGGGNGGNDGNGRPPRRPRPNMTPNTPEQIANTQDRLARALRARPYVLGTLNALLFSFERGDDDDDRPMDLADLLTGKWMNDESLMRLLMHWPELRGPVKWAIGQIAAAHRDTENPAAAYNRAIEHLIEALTPEQIASIAGVINRARVSGTQKRLLTAPGQAQAITDALMFMDAAQLAAMSPLATAMIDLTPLRTHRLRVAVRALLMHVFNIDDWMSLAVSALKHIRGDRQ